MLRLKRMERTEPFFGFKNKKLKKMAQLKVTNGYPLQNTLVIGVIIAKKASESSITRMVINTKVCGQLTSATVRELTGRMKTKNSDVSILATGSKTRSMAVAHFSTKMVTAMMVIGSMDCHKERVE
jgi:hypothetical protein